jgi:hypothetical protein
MLCSDVVDGAQNGSGISALYDRLRGSESAAIEKHRPRGQEVLQDRQWGSRWHVPPSLNLPDK